MKMRFSAGRGATSIKPSAGSMTTIATEAEILSWLPGRGGRHTEYGAPNLVTPVPV